MRIILLTVLAASLVVAAPIVNLFNTGQNGIDGIDERWTVNGGPAFVTNPSRYPFPLWKKTSVASWISPQADYDSSSDAPDTTFIFSTTFNMPAHFSSVSVLMLVAADNALQDVQLNGISLEYLAAMTVLPGNTFPTRIIADSGRFITGFGPSMNIASGLRSGLNKLDFVVRNSATDADNSGNPSGLMVAFTSNIDITDAPEPASFVLLGVGLTFIGLLSRQREKIKNTLLRC
jgi:hypothetical protein